MSRRFVLSIDGGGIRGIIPVSLLAKLEQVTGKRTRDVFSFVAGTSTGAIIAAGVAAGIPADTILDLYISQARQVFPQRPWNVLSRIFSGSMYSTRKLHDLLAQELGPARDWTINQSPVDLLITAKRVSDSKPWYFVRDRSTNSCRTGRLKLVDCVTASAAAPTYFGPWTIAEDPASLAPGCEPVGTLVDGGVGVAGNPVYQACVEAFLYTDQYPPSDTTVISLGTGQFPYRAQPTWIGAWLEWVLEELLRSPAEQQSELVRRHFSETAFYRLNPNLRQLDPGLKQDVPMDDVGHIAQLVGYGRSYAQQVDWLALLEGRETRFRQGSEMPVVPTVRERARPMI